MKKRMIKCLGWLLTLTIYDNVLATSVPGPLVTVTGAGGQSGTISVNVWLNGDGPLSGQSFQVTGGNTLTVTPTIPNHTYPAMGLEVKTAGVSIVSGCDRYVGSRCIFSSSKSNPATITVSGSPSANHYIFITSSAYDGNLGGTSGADTICNTVALTSPYLTISALTFKALLLDSSRTPCNSLGNCGGSSAIDWPLLPNTQYLNPDDTSNPQLLTNEFSVFPQPAGTTTTLQNQTGGLSTNPFWSGIQSVYNDASDPVNITKWAYENVNPNSVNNWNTYLATCQSWSSDSSSDTANSGKSGTIASNFGAVTGGIWGNYYEQLDTTNFYTINSWNGLIKYTCNNSLNLVCVSQ